MQVGTQNAYVVVISYVAMFIYVSLALGKFPHPVASRALLGLQGEGAIFKLIMIVRVASAAGTAR